MKTETRLVTQPNALPTRKVFVGAVTAFATAAAQSYAADLAASVPALAWLALDTAKAAVPVMVGFGVSYLVRDRAGSGSNQQ